METRVFILKSQRDSVHTSPKRGAHNNRRTDRRPTSIRLLVASVFVTKMISPVPGHPPGGRRNVRVYIRVQFYYYY